MTAPFSCEHPICWMDNDSPPGVTAPCRMGVVYFAERDGLIKIGWTRNLPQRLRALRQGSASIDGMRVGPLTLRLAFSGTRSMEQGLHEMFRDTRVGGEWFQPSKDLDDLCELYAAVHDVVHPDPLSRRSDRQGPAEDPR